MPPKRWGLAHVDAWTCLYLASLAVDVAWSGMVLEVYCMVCTHVPSYLSDRGWNWPCPRLQCPAKKKPRRRCKTRADPPFHFTQACAKTDGNKQVSPLAGLPTSIRTLLMRINRRLYTPEDSRVTRGVPELITKPSPCGPLGLTTFSPTTFSSVSFSPFLRPWYLIIQLYSK